MKHIVLPALMLLVVTSLIAQSGTHMNFGIKAGLQAAKLGQPVINWDTKYRWHAGFLAHLHMSRHFAIQPELIYSAQGAEHITATTDTQIELGYLNIPVAFQYMTGSGFRFNGQVYSSQFAVSMTYFETDKPEEAGRVLIQIKSVILQLEI